MVASTGGEPGGRIEKMSILLKKMKDYVQTTNIGNDDIEGGNCLVNLDDFILCQKIIHHDFRCPIFLELMTDPVFVSSGETYECSCIDKWFEAGHGTCPKTQKTLSSTVRTPNNVLRSLVAQFCEAKGIEQRKGSLKSKSASAYSPAERSEIRLLSKRNADNRVAIAEAGAIPLLVDLLCTPDSGIQERML
ncbi:hypothetical protein RIF29_27129 [Crotalaria pallida]|uniref:RING-type E3 ubiquitin transferase n=1 Tax=Crotalaria pallida TaxID=3830 RepID=A0AAN9I597_CROPI